MLNFDKPLQTRSGHPAVLVYHGDNPNILERLLGADSYLGHERVVALLEDGTFIGVNEAGGYYRPHEGQHLRDLVNAPERQTVYSYVARGHVGYAPVPMVPIEDHAQVKLTFEDDKLVDIEIVHP